jgi:hypothetical protein
LTPPVHLNSRVVKSCEPTGSHHFAFLDFDLLRTEGPDAYHPPIGNWSQPTATVSARVSRVRFISFATGCHQLRPLGSINAPYLAAEDRVDASSVGERS